MDHEHAHAVGRGGGVLIQGIDMGGSYLCYRGYDRMLDGTLFWGIWRVHVLGTHLLISLQVRTREVVFQAVLIVIRDHEHYQGFHLIDLK